MIVRSSFVCCLLERGGVLRKKQRNHMIQASSWSSRFPVRGCLARLGFAAQAKS